MVCAAACSPLLRDLPLFIFCLVIRISKSTEFPPHFPTLSPTFLKSFSIYSLILYHTLLIINRFVIIINSPFPVPDFPLRISKSSFIVSPFLTYRFGFYAPSLLFYGISFLFLRGIVQVFTGYRASFYGVSCKFSAPATHNSFTRHPHFHFTDKCCKKSDRRKKQKQRTPTTKGYALTDESGEGAAFCVKGAWS